MWQQKCHAGKRLVMVDNDQWETNCDTSWDDSLNDFEVMRVYCLLQIQKVCQVPSSLKELGLVL